MAVLLALTSPGRGYKPGSEARFAEMAAMEAGRLSCGRSCLGFVQPLLWHVFYKPSLGLVFSASLGSKHGAVLYLWGLRQIPGRFRYRYVDQPLLRLFTQRIC